MIHLNFNIEATVIAGPPSQESFDINSPDNLDKSKNSESIKNQSADQKKGDISPN